MFRLMSYILNSKLIDDNESGTSNVNAEPSSSSQSETYAESDTQEDENSEVDDKLSNSSSSEKELSLAKPCANLKKDKKQSLSGKKKFTMNVSNPKKRDERDKSDDFAVKSIEDKEILKNEKHDITTPKVAMSKPKISKVEKSKTRIDFPKKEVKSEKSMVLTEDEDDVPLKKLKRTNSTEVSDTPYKMEKEMKETMVDKTIKDVAEFPKKRSVITPSKDIEVKKGKFKVVQPKKFITRPVVRKSIELPVTLPVKSTASTPKCAEQTPKKPQSEIERLKELEAQRAAKKPKLKIAKNIVKELKEKDEQLLKAKIGETFKEESIRSSLTESKTDNPIILPPMKFSTSEAAASISYEDVKSPSTVLSCVSPCFSEESRPSAAASHKDESNDEFNESIVRSISPSNSESTVTGNESQRSRSYKRTFRKNPRKKSSSNSRRSSHSVSEDGSVIEAPAKTSKKFPKRAGIIFNIGCKLEAMDFQQKWYMAKIIEIDQEKAEILIHFDGWSSRYDEWISMRSKKLRAVAQPKPGKKDPKEKICQQFKAGEKVLARWSDNKMYPAIIKELQPENFYLVEFLDGFAKKLSYTCIAKVPTELVEKLTQDTHPLPLAAVKKLQVEEEISNDLLLKNILNRSLTDDDSNLNSPGSGFVPKKQFKVEEDHNQFKCHYESCNKSFRKEILLTSHIKHYHRLLKPKEVTPRKKKVPIEKTSTLIQIPLSSTSDLTSPIVKTEVTDEPKEDEIKMELDENSLPTTEDIDSIVIKDENQPKPLTPDAKLVPETIKIPLTLPPKFVTGKGIYPITKMETRHAKLRFQKDDSVYTNYKTVALGIQRPRRVSESKPDKVKAVIKNEKVVGRPKNNSESSARGPNVRARLSESKKSRKNRGERKHEDNSGKSEVKKPKIEKDEDTQEKNETVGPVTRRRADRYSESTNVSKTDETIKDDLEELADIGDDTIDDKEVGKEDEVVHCVCEVNEENGLMIQCEVCMTWQHGSCFSIEEIEQVPDKYICYACTNPRGLRRSFKYKLDQEFFKSGELPTFNEMGTNCKQSCSILAAHELVSSMHNIVNVLHSIDYKINLAKEGVKDNFDLKYFSKPWKKLSASNESLNESTLTAKSNNLDAELTLDAETTERVLKAIADEGISDPKDPLIEETFMNSLKSPESALGFTTLDHSYFSVKDNNPDSTGKLLEIAEIEDKAQQDQANLNSACSSTDSMTATTTTEDTDADFAGISGGVTSVFPEDMSDSEPELRIALGDRNPNPPQARSKTATKGKSGGLSGTRKRGRTRRNYFGHQPQLVEHIPKVEENYDREAAKENILDHISDVQLNLENKLDLIEGQLKILEAEYGEDPSDQDQYGVDSEDDDLPKLLQSIKNLSKDLTLVERLAVL